jgi:hypothetical protein
VIAGELLDSAELILGEPRYPSAGVWPRAVALLARQALEVAMLEFWMVRAPGLEWCTTHAQLLCLPDYVRDREIAESASHAWNSLSRVCHHHPYELLPTAAELRVLLDSTRRFVVALASDQGLPPAA